MTQTQRVLIADDSAFARQLMKNIMESAGYEVVGECEDGTTVTQAYRELRPDFLLLDIMMPNKDGVQVLKEIMQIDRAAKIIVVTSAGLQQIKTECYKEGALEVVMKPYTAEELLGVLKKFGR